MSLLHHPRVQATASRHLLCRVEHAYGRFAVTFDDGPSPTWTPRVLDVLAAFGARATFFQLGFNVSRHPDLVRRVRDEGHELAVHGMLHLPPPVLPRMLLGWEVERGRAAIEAATGESPRHYRPAYGLMRPRQAARVRLRGLHPVLGDIYPRDVERPGAERIARRVLERLKAGSIVILHDASGLLDQDRSQTVDALERILTAAREWGLAAVSVRELRAAANGASPAGAAAPTGPAPGTGG